MHFLSLLVVLSQVNSSRLVPAARLDRPSRVCGATSVATFLDTRFSDVALIWLISERNVFIMLTGDIASSSGKKA